MLRDMRGAVIGVVGCVACGGGAVCDLADVAPGELSGAVEGAPWATTGVAWNETGDGIQVTTDAADGQRLTLSLQRDVDGAPMAERVAGEPPVQVGFDDESAAWALLTSDDLGSLTSKGTTGGWLTVDAIDGTTLGLCFAFDATGDGGTVRVEGAGWALGAAR